MSCLKKPSPGLQEPQRSCRMVLVFAQWSTCQRPLPPGWLTLQIAQQLPCADSIRLYSATVNPYLFLRAVLKSRAFTLSGLAARQLMFACLARSGLTKRHFLEFALRCNRRSSSVSFLSGFFSLKACRSMRRLTARFLLCALIRSLLLAHHFAYLARLRAFRSSSVKRILNLAIGRGSISIGSQDRCGVISTASVRTV